jgi:hypothetical protein
MLEDTPEGRWAMAKKLRRRVKRGPADAFIPFPAYGERIVSDDAESLAEEFIAMATSAEYVLEDARNEVSMDEIGGPYLEIEVPLVDVPRVTSRTG